MRIRRADDLNAWSKDKAGAGYYGPNSLVWYKKDDFTQGFAYRAKPNYQKTETPPDESDQWVKDYTYYLPWNKDSKYEIGMRVYYFNGQRTYGYKASKRYFGGNQPPNEEVDGDGIRTWEIDFQYKSYFYYEGFPSEFLFPVKKRVGYIDGKVNAFNITDPEERPYADAVLLPDGSYYQPYEGLIDFLNEKKVLSEDWSELNSKYQSFAYDDDTYIFYEIKLDADNKPIHRKKGIHRAKFLKELNPNDVIFKYAESQFFWTFKRGIAFRYGIYYEPHGFSVEMWPNATDDDYEFVPSYGFKTFGVFTLGEGGSGSFTVPFSNPRIVFSEYLPYSDGIVINGNMSGPENSGPNYDETPDEFCIFDAYFGRNCPAFDYRNGTINLLRIDEPYEWVSVPQYCEDPDTKQIYKCGKTWTSKQVRGPDDPIIYDFVQETIDSFESSYKFDNTFSKVRDKNDNPIDFRKYRSDMTVTVIGWAGAKWE